MRCGQRRLDATALTASGLHGVTEARAGVYVFFDLAMRNVGVCTLHDIALSVLTTVIGHQDEKGWAITDAGWMAMSRDRGTQNQKSAMGWCVPSMVSRLPIADRIFKSANQEHGILHISGNDSRIVSRFPIGTRLRIFPNHACATGAQHPEYHAILQDGEVETWPRFYGW